MIIKAILVKLGMLTLAVHVVTVISFLLPIQPPMKLLFLAPNQLQLKLHLATNVAVTLPLSPLPTPVVVTPETSPIQTTTPIPAQVETSTSDDLYAEWTKVAICEEGGWVGSSGPAYPDSLGINATNWYANGGTSDVSPAAQIAVAERIQTNVPDQSGCAAW